MTSSSNSSMSAADEPLASRREIVAAAVTVAAAAIVLKAGRSTVPGTEADGRPRQWIGRGELLHLGRPARHAGARQGRAVCDRQSERVDHRAEGRQNDQFCGSVSYGLLRQNHGRPNRRPERRLERPRNLGVRGQPHAVPRRGRQRHCAEACEVPASPRSAGALSGAWRQRIAEKEALRFTAPEWSTAPMREYEFEVTIVAVVRVRAGNEDRARAENPVELGLAAKSISENDGLAILPHQRSVHWRRRAEELRALGSRSRSPPVGDGRPLPQPSRRRAFDRSSRRSPRAIAHAR